MSSRDKNNGFSLFLLLLNVGVVVTHNLYLSYLLIIKMIFELSTIVSNNKTEKVICEKTRFWC